MVNLSVVRHDWTVEEIESLLRLPLLDLLQRAREVHVRFHDDTVQLASLLSIKTGGCPEDCSYCPQSAHHGNEVDITREPMMKVAEVLARAKAAQAAGATRFCMGAAWRRVKDGEEFSSVLDMVRGVRQMGMEACVTLGMLTRPQARSLAEAGLTSYNHNIDTSPEFYGNIVTTREYADRLETLAHVRAEGIRVCCGGIIGMGEDLRDRAGMLQVLAAMDPHPESVPMNALVAVKGTPLENRPQGDPLDLVRMCAVARITMPQSRVRLSAGRAALSREAQTLCFMAGANSIFYGEKLLTTGNSAAEDDLRLLNDIGLRAERLGENASSRKAKG